MKDTKYINKEEIEYIEIVNINTNEEIVTLSYVEGNLLIQTKEPYKNYVKYIENDLKEEGDKENEIK